MGRRSLPRSNNRAADPREGTRPGSLPVAGLAHRHPACRVPLLPRRCDGDHMAKKAKARQPRAVPATKDAMFVRAVAQLYHLAMKRRPWDKGNISIAEAIKALPVPPDAKLSEADQIQVRIV